MERKSVDIPLCSRSGALFLAVFLLSSYTAAQKKDFQWVNPPSGETNPRLHHGSFRSPSMRLDVGYFIYLPPGYEETVNGQTRYPVVYFLHGGRHGNEKSGAKLVDQLDEQIRSGLVSPRIYVFNNGGELSHYDYGGSLGETAFVAELIPHIDCTYRTIPTRFGRGIEGISMGGRGTARIMFRHPELFCSAIPIAAGHQREKRISEGGSQETLGVTLDSTNNSWDLARQYPSDSTLPPLEILVVVGTKDPNYQANLEWMAHLRSLAIPFQSLIIPDTPHSMIEVYRNAGSEIMRFHERCFGQTR